MNTEIDGFLTNAQESFAGAESELKNKRYNNSANRCYYACFQAAIAILLKEGIKPKGKVWSHTFVQGSLVTELMDRRKLLSHEIHDTLAKNQELRETADYEPEKVNEIKAKRALKRTKFFIERIEEVNYEKDQNNTYSRSIARASKHN